MKVLGPRFLAPLETDAGDDPRVSVDVRLEPADYAKLYARARRRAMGWADLGVWIVLTAAATAIAADAALRSDVVSVDWTALACGLAFLAVYVCLARMARRRMLPDAGGVRLGPHTFSVSPDGLEAQGPLSRSVLRWPAVRAIEETADALFVFFDRTSGMVIPKRAFRSTAEGAAFQDELRERARWAGAETAASTPRIRRAFVLALAGTLAGAGTVGWHRAHPPEPSGEVAASDEATEDDLSRGEDIMYAQQDLMDAEIEALLPERPGVVDLYAVAFAGDSGQDVFMKEALYAKELLDRRFDTRGRSIALVNNRSTSGDHPLASLTNLRTALDEVGARMNPDEDVLFLFLTSHGSRDHVLSVQYPTLPLLEIGAKDLADVLEESHIEWRVVVISACYSGGFIDALKNDHTLVITAAAADRKSFGCNNEADFTYFGKAFFEEQLEKQFSFVQAFAGADAEIRRRETADALEPSKPQISAPEPIVGKLGELEHRLAGMIASSLPLTDRERPVTKVGPARRRSRPGSFGLQNAELDVEARLARGEAHRDRKVALGPAL